MCVVVVVLVVVVLLCCCFCVWCVCVVFGVVVVVVVRAMYTTCESVLTRRCVQLLTGMPDTSGDYSRASAPPDPVLMAEPHGPAPMCRNPKTTRTQIFVPHVPVSTPVLSTRAVAVADAKDARVKLRTVVAGSTPVCPGLCSIQRQRHHGLASYRTCCDHPNSRSVLTSGKDAMVTHRNGGQWQGCHGQTSIRTLL